MSTKTYHRTCLNCHYMFTSESACKCGMRITHKHSYQAMKRKHEIEGFRIAIEEVIEMYLLDGLAVPSRDKIDKLITMYYERFKADINNIFETKNK